MAKTDGLMSHLEWTFTKREGEGCMPRVAKIGIVLVLLAVARRWR